MNNQKKEQEETLPQFLANKVFADSKGITCKPKKEDVESFECFMESYRKGLGIEAKAVELYR